MITLLIGGRRGESNVEKEIGDLGSCVKVLNAEKEGSFLEFCRRAVRSTQNLRIVKYEGEDESSLVKANDNFAVYFSRDYVNSYDDLKRIIFKLATVIEVAHDLRLDVEIIGVDDISDALATQWPSHWPEIRNRNPTPVLIHNVG